VRGGSHRRRGLVGTRGFAVGFTACRRGRGGCRGRGGFREANKGADLFEELFCFKGYFEIPLGVGTQAAMLLEGFVGGLRGEQDKRELAKSLIAFDFVADRVAAHPGDLDAQHNEIRCPLFQLGEGDQTVRYRIDKEVSVFQGVFEEIGIFCIRLNEQDLLFRHDVSGLFFLEGGAVLQGCLLPGHSIK